MPLRALFNPSLYGNLTTSTARVYFSVRTPKPRAHSTTASPSLAWSPQALSPPVPCCSHPHTPFNQDHLYWRHHSPRLLPSLLDKFHEIEQLYRGNVEYVRRMTKDNPGLLEGLAFRGQRPPFMLVDCSDSRVNESGIFDAEPGTMFTAGNIANMFDEGDTSSNAVLTYAVTTLKVKHVVVMGHYGCGGVAASMAPLPKGYRERWLSPTSLSLPPSFDSPADLAVQRWIAPIRHLYESSARWEIQSHRELVRSILDSGEASEEEVSRVLMGTPGEEGVGGVKGLHLHDPAFRALVEENVKANVWRVSRSRVIRDHHTAYTRSLSAPEPSSPAPDSPAEPPMNPVYVHGWVYDLETGVVTDLNVSSGPPGWVPPPGGVQGFPSSRGRGEEGEKR